MTADLDLATFGRASRDLPQVLNDGDDVRQRVTRAGDVFAYPLGEGKRSLADEGSYFTACFPTPGTGIQLNANVTAFSDTNGFLVVKNTEQPGNTRAKRVFWDYLRLLLVGTAPTATVSMEFAIKRSGFSREPTTAANRTPLTPVNMASAGGRNSIAQVFSYANAGAMTIPASAASDPVAARFRIPTSLGITGDEYVAKFGGDDLGPVPGLTAARATAVARIGAAAPPIITEPGEWTVLHMWWLTAATTAATFELEFGWWER